MTQKKNGTVSATISATWVSGPTDITAAARAAFWHPMLLAIAATAPLHVWMGIRAGMAGEFSTSWLILLGLSAVAGFPVLLARRHCQSRTEAQRTLSCVVHADHVDIETHSGSSTLWFKDIRGWGQNRIIFALLLATGGAIGIPKRALKPGDEQRVEHFLQNAVFVSGHIEKDRRRWAWTWAIGGWVVLLGAIAILWPLFAG